MAKAPAFQFYVRDWLSDPELQSASAASRGIWMNALCFMWEARDRGKIEGTIPSLSRLLNCTELEFKAFLEESSIYHFNDLVTFGNGKVTLINRRMTRDQKTRENTKIRVARFRSNAESIGKVTLPSSSSSSSSSSKKEKKVRKKELPPDEQFWKEVREIYTWIDIDFQISKMKGYQLTPKGKKWKMTRKSVIAWLNREDKPLGTPVKKTSIPKAEEPQWLKDYNAEVGNGIKT